MAEKLRMNIFTFGRIRVVGECPTNQYKSIPLFGVMVQVKSQTCEWSPFVMTILGLLSLSIHMAPCSRAVRLDTFCISFQWILFMEQFDGI